MDKRKKIWPYLFKKMKANELNEMRKKEALFLLDVRTPVEFGQGSISGAVNIPLDRILEGESLPVPEGAEICIICQSGKRAERAARFLEERYGRESILLEGGMNAWQERGLPVRKAGGGHGVTLIRQVQIIIGLVNLLGFLLAWLVSGYWLFLPVATSMGLVVAGMTGVCGLAVVLSRMPWNKE